MKILLVAATASEIESVLTKLAAKATQNGIIEYLVSGVGAVQTTYCLTRRLSKNPPDFVIGAGIGGCFSGDIELGTVFQVRSEVFADLGVQESSGWRDVFGLGLADKNQFPFSGGWLNNPYPPLSISATPGTGCTVNEVTTNPAKVQIIQSLYSPNVESMEGAAVHYVCLNEGIPFIHLRSVSNLVGERDKKHWSMKAAIEKLGIAIDETVEALLKQN